MATSGQKRKSLRHLTLDVFACPAKERREPWVKPKFIPV
jgi:hypothetical protein